MTGQFVSADAAGWIDLTPWGPFPLNRTIGQMVPNHFDAAVRVLHPVPVHARLHTFYLPWREAAKQTGRALDRATRPQDVLIALDKLAIIGPPPFEQWALGATRGCAEWNRICRTLRPHTASDELCIAVWHSWANDPPPTSIYHGANERYAIAKLPLDDLAELHAVAWSGVSSPNMWWPKDRAWFAHTHLDDFSTVVAGTRAAMDDLLADPELETFPVDFDDLFGG